MHQFRTGDCYFLFITVIFIVVMISVTYTNHALQSWRTTKITLMFSQPDNPMDLRTNLVTTRAENMNL